MREYKPYYLQVSALIANASKDIAGLFSEHNAEEIRLKNPMRVTLETEYAGGRRRTCKIVKIRFNNGLIAICTRNRAYYLYHLSELMDICYIYEEVYNHFKNN